MRPIILATLNASYIHASLGLRCLKANMGSLASRTRLREFTIAQRAEDVAEMLLADNPIIIGFGIYIWNVSETTDILHLLKTLRPDITLVVGGPEVSFELESQPIKRLADHVITGQADLAFADTCRLILDDGTAPAVISPLPFALDELASPYAGYDADDVAHRVLYVEASRGCPFKCEFCLSSLDKSATAFDIDRFLIDMRQLIERGARRFKFVDRTFNLKIDTSRRILEFFLGHIDKHLFLHFELIPDRLPEALRVLLQRFPAGSLQFEIGIQSFNPEVQALVSRRQHHQRTCDNLRWLRTQTRAHIHTDLIFGLPGETLTSFAAGFDTLYALGPQEIQLGILKRLRGTPINRHTERFAMRYMSKPPYRVLATRDVDFATMQRVVRFARYWDLLANAGRFPHSLPLLLGEHPFDHFLALSDWLYQATGQTHRIALQRWFALLRYALPALYSLDHVQVHTALMADFRHNRLRGELPAAWRHEAATNRSATATSDDNRIADHRTAPADGAQRQHRHLGKAHGGNPVAAAAVETHHPQENA